MKWLVERFSDLRQWQVRETLNLRSGYWKSSYTVQSTHLKDLTKHYILRL